MPRVVKIVRMIVAPLSEDLPDQNPGNRDTGAALPGMHVRHSVTATGSPSRFSGMCPNRFKLCQPVGWFEQPETHRGPTRRIDGFRCVQQTEESNSIEYGPSFRSAENARRTDERRRRSIRVAEHIPSTSS
jgi:hypothetical protein